VRVEWAPDGRSVLCFSEWGLRVTIWSLVTGSATYIQFPKYPEKGYTFRSDGRYFVLAERHKSKDMVSVYDAADSYKTVRHFPVQTASLASLSLSPTGNNLAIWEGPLEYKLYIHTLAGDLLASFSPDPDPGLGIRNVAWHPNGMFLAVGGYDDKVHILSHLTWNVVATVSFQSRIPNGSPVNVWREPLRWLESTHRRGFLAYDRPSLPFSISSTRADPSKANPKSGAVQLEWNINGSLLLVRFESSPTVAHIYSFPQPNEPFAVDLRTVLVHSQPVTHVQWNPVRAGNLCLSCDTGAVYTWSDEWVGESGDEEMAECIAVPAQKFQTKNVSWAPDGKGMLLFDRDTFCCAFEAEDDRVQ